LCHLISNVTGQPQRKHILSRHRAYHGSSYLSASVSGKERDKSSQDTIQGTIHFLSAPSHYHHGRDLDEATFCDALVKELEEKIAAVGAENIMCYIAEPVLASGGVIVPPADYNRRCAEVVRRHGIIYIADEVVTAFGRLGHWFASEEVFGVVPDIITFAKGVTSGYLPLGGFAISDKLMSRITGDNARGNIFSTGYTWSGNPVSCRAALASWDIIERESLLEHVRDVGPYFQQQLATLCDLQLVGAVRGMGLMAAVELDASAIDGDDELERDYQVADLVDYHCHQQGLMVRPLINMCVMSPPLVISREQVDELVDAMRKGIQAAQQELGLAV
jgi:adenosylmethionine-8-amino-7-oxononanoate aminotransferase